MPKTLTEVFADKIKSAEAEGRPVILPEHAYRNMSKDARLYLQQLAEFSGVPLELGH